MTMENVSMKFGERLLPQVVDDFARYEPDRVYASIPKSQVDLSVGFQDVTMARLASIVDHVSWRIENTVGPGSFKTIAYIGPSDLRYAVIFLAGVKCGYKVLFISPKIQISQNTNMLLRTQCMVLCYAEESDALVSSLNHHLPKLATEIMPSLEELLNMTEHVEHYEYNKTFNEAKDEPCLILHSSGSTGDPKLVTMTHGTFAVTDNDRFMPTPEGRFAQNASLFNLNGGGKFYSCFPPYHLAGVHAYIDLPIFSTTATVVFGPTHLPPSGALLSAILQQQYIRAFYVPPFIIEQWATEPLAFEQAKQLDFILYGGAPLSPHVGENLSKVTDLCQMYGSLELGQVQLLVPQKGEWSYLELNPFEEADMQPTGDGTFEMVLHQESQLAARRSLWHNFPDVKLWRTGDLFIPHHTKPGLWRFHSRIDDFIVFSSSHKLRPLEMETILHGNPLIAGALIVGQGRPEPSLIVEPKFGVYEGDPESLINGIWSSVQEANNIAPTYAKLRRSRVMIATPDKPFIRAPKGSIVRKLTIQLYIDNIEAAYTDGPLHHKDNENPRLSLRSFILPGVKAFICSCIEEHIPKDLLSDVDNFFLRGLDSLGAAAFSRKLGMGLENGPQYPIRVAVSLQTINKYPTVNGLAATIVNSMLNHGEILFSSVQDTRKLEATVVEFTENLSPYPYTTSTVESLKADSGLNVVLIGPRGSLGPHILRNLLQRTSVNEIYCLNRGNDGREKLQNAFTAQGLPLLSESENSRVHFMAIALGEPRLGLCRDDYATLLENADIIIHNAWKVNFSWTLEAYKPEYIHSVRAVIDLATTSPSRPRIVFISSISSVQAWAAVIQSPVPERQLEGPDSYRVASPLGYGQSKHVSEKILVQASIKSGIPVTILRVGQVAGSTRDTGSPWSTDEWIPSLAAISKTLRLIPVDIPPIDWIPVDIVGQVISELTLSSNEDKKKVLQSAPLKVFNVVNPHLTDWSVFVDVLRARIGENAKLVALVEWVHSLSITDPKAMSTAEATASTKILPFFQHLADTAATGAALQPKFETTSTVTGSPTMARVQAIDKRLIDLWCQQWGV